MKTHRGEVPSRSIPTWTAQIFIGQRVRMTGEFYPSALLLTKCHDFCEVAKLGITITTTTYLYPGGQEPGFIIGLINYPRFPRPINHLRQMAIDLAEELRRELSQERVSILFQDETIVLGEGLS